MKRTTPKPTSPSDAKSLRARLRDAEHRVKEAEQTLEAIRSGAVDALVVSSPQGEQVFTLQGADHRYRRIVEGMSEGAAIVSKTGLVLYANAAFATLVDKPLDRVLGSLLGQYVPHAYAKSFERLVKGARKGTVAIDAELVARERNVRVHVSASPDSEGQGSICLILTDLTGAVHQEELRFQFVADMLPQIIWAAGPDGALEYCNRRWFELTGRMRSETRGETWEDILHPEDLQRHRESWARSVKMGQPYEISYRFKRGSDGAYRWHLARALPHRNAEGDIIRWYGSCTDIEDERALVVEAERARDKAEEATRLKDEFLATLSHELRTPLNAILGWGRMLQANTLAADKRPVALDAVVRNARAQHQLIEDLLDVSRIVSGKLLLETGPVSLRDIAAAALDVVRPAADAKGVRLLPVLGADPAQLSGDASRLQQVVWNLLTNAVKFTPRGGKVQIGLRHEASWAELSVTDTGSGIDAAFLPRAFDRFRQQDGTITRRAGGLGLGLSIVKNIVEMHGGTVEAHSDGEGTGARFVVRLPITIAIPRPVPSRPDLRWSQKMEVEAANAPGLKDLKVLVVDDDADARDLLTLDLERYDAMVTTAASAAEALAMIPKLKPDIIVSDIGMPGEDGYSFIRRVRALAQEEGGRTPAIALSAYARAEDRALALTAGFQSHAAKPLNPREMLTIIANLSERSP